MKTGENSAKETNKAEKEGREEAATSVATDPVAATATEQTGAFVSVELVGLSPKAAALENRAPESASVLPGPAVSHSAAPLPELFASEKISTEQVSTPAPRPLVLPARDSAIPKAEQLSSVQFGSVSEGKATLRAPADEPTTGSVPIARTSTQTVSASGVTFIRPSTLTVRAPEESLSSHPASGRAAERTRRGSGGSEELHTVQHGSVREENGRNTVRRKPSFSGGFFQRGGRGVATGVGLRLGRPLFSCMVPDCRV